MRTCPFYMNGDSFMLEPAGFDTLEQALEAAAIEMVFGTSHEVWIEDRAGEILHNHDSEMIQNAIAVYSEKIGAQVTHFTIRQIAAIELLGLI